MITSRKVFSALMRVRQFYVLYYLIKPRPKADIVMIGTIERRQEGGWKIENWGFFHSSEWGCAIEVNHWNEVFIAGWPIHDLWLISRSLNPDGETNLTAGSFEIISPTPSKEAA